MPISVNVSGMSYNGLSYAQRDAIEKQRKSRLTQVRQQSKTIAQRVREKVQCEKENQLKRVQDIKKRELDEWKQRRQCEIQHEYGSCLSKLGEAHIAACEASCEEDEASHQRREEFDLLAAQRGRSSMLQEQRKRDREAEERLAKRKRKQQKNASVQADFVSRRHFGTNSQKFEEDDEDEDVSGGEEEAGTRVETFVNKPNLHKSTASSYNPKNFTSHSIDSSNNCDSEPESSLEVESVEEFNQITNLLKQKCADFYKEPPVEIPDDVIEVSESEDEPPPPRKTKQVKLPAPTRKKSILKKAPSPKSSKRRPKSPKKAQLNEQRVKYVDFGNKFVTSYVPDEDLVTHSRTELTTNARTAAKHHEQAGGARSVSDDVLRQLAEIRSKETLEKERTRRDYEQLRMELDEASKREKEAKEAARNTFRNLPSQLSKQEQNRKMKMNEAVEDAMKRNILTCPPVDSKKTTAKKSCEVNVAAPESSSSSEKLQNPAPPARKSNDEVTNLVKVERLKDLLERINRQKSLLLREIEKSEDVPGRDLEQVVTYLERLQQEKAALDAQVVVDVEDKKKMEIEALHSRERKIEEREKRLEGKIRELYKSQQKEAAEKTIPESVTSSEAASSIPPVEIIIKVQTKSPKRAGKHRKSFRCVDTLNREPGKVYPRTPRKKKSASDDSDEKLPEKPEQVQQQTQTSPPTSEVPKTILKKPQNAPTAKAIPSRPSDDSSVSTTYQSLPDRINVEPQPAASEVLRKPHHKLNPVLMHYITRLLGMGKNIGNQLSVSVSTVSTPGSSTINTSGNAGSQTEAQVPAFDQNRLDKLREFINDNYSFLSEINETLERSQLEDQSEDNISKVDGIWRDVLRKKKATKPQSAEPKKSSTSIATQKTQSKTSEARQSVTKAVPPQKPQTVIAPAVQRPQIAQRPSITSQRPQTAATSSHRPQGTPSTTQRPQTAATPPPPTASSSNRTQTAASQSQAQPSHQITNRDMLNVTKYLESHMLNNYAEYTANCQKRIADLAQMMERVRQEKLKLIENSLSSGEFGHFTEYKEIVMGGKTQDAPTTSASDLKESPSQREDPPSEEINNILQKQTRPFGVSKDSGISMLSRPVTSSDFRESPDTRVTSEERENTFQPILKDIPKPPRVKVTPVDGTQADAVKEQEDKAQKKLKPPLSFSPLLEKPHEPHELSTIAEVETPSTSKVNLIEDSGVGGIQPFPNFEEYTTNLQANAQSSIEASSAFLQLDDLKNALDELKVKSFVDPREYGIPEMSQENLSRSSSNASSIVDIYEELKRRKIIEKPFQEVDDENHTTPTATLHLVDPRSPQRRPAVSRIFIKTPENVEIEIQQRTPTKRRPMAEIPTKSDSPKSSDTLSGIQEIEKEPRDDIEKDLKGMGMNWAASMLRRGGESKKLESSSSTSSVDKLKSTEIHSQLSTCETSSSSSTGRPLNLREFLARELTKRSHGNKSLSDESSLSSQFMRSLLNASSGNTSTHSSDRDRLRTSTPVHTKGSSLIAAQRTANSQLFTGESLSTLKGSEGNGSDHSSGKERHHSN